jgi:hypothetical protein
MRNTLLFAAALLSGCASDDIFLLRPLPPASEPSSEVIVIRPRSTVQAEWPFYIVVADQPVFDLRNGENTRFRMSSGRQTLTIRCGSGTAEKPVETRIEQDLPPRGSAYFIVEPKFDCVGIKAVGADEAATGLRTTRFRPVGEVNRLAQSTGEAPAIFTSVPAAPVAASAAATSAATSASANPRVASATAAWVEAFNSRDVARLASLYDSDAVLRDTSGQRIAAGPGAIADYFTKSKAQGTVSIGEQEIRVFGDTAVDSGTNTLGRYNIVYRNRAGKWLIVDHNTSAPQR